MGGLCTGQFFDQVQEVAGRQNMKASAQKNPTLQTAIKSRQCVKCHVNNVPQQIDNYRNDQFFT